MTSGFRRFPVSRSPARQHLGRSPSSPPQSSSLPGFDGCELPGIDGLEATRRVRERDSPPVVLLLSTYDEDLGEHFVTESCQCLRSPASAYVTKSAFWPDVLDAVGLPRPVDSSPSG